MHFSLIIQLWLLIFTPESTSEVIQDKCISSEEQELYALIMEYRQDLGLPEIPLSASLSEVAALHARDLDEQYEYGEEGDCNMHSWSRKGKWKGCCYTSDHKNPECMWNKPEEIAGYASPGYEISYFFSGGADAEKSLAGWQKSPAHNAVVTNQGIWEEANWQAIGIGIHGKYSTVWFGEKEDESRPCVE